LDIKNKLLSRLPAVNDFLADEEVQKLIEKYGRKLVLAEIRQLISNSRSELINLIEQDEVDAAKSKSESFKVENLRESLQAAIEKTLRPNLAPAVNATGVVVHTNLGRSLLSERAKEMLQMVSSHYTTLEIDRESGERGSRYDNVAELLCQLTGAEDALVVNNNAAAVLLALSALAADQEVIISRGELIEIGGSFRIPEVMKQSGAKLREVGTTNKVYPEDFVEAINEETALLLKVHTSNYRVVGFTREISLEELVRLGEEYNLPVLDDLGSGVFTNMEQVGLTPEPTVEERVAAGADLVTFSGDKILGGPQAGIIVGSKDYIAKLKNHPLTRAIRVDKYTLAALEGTLKAYQDPEGVMEEIPTLRMLSSPTTKLQERAERLLEAIEEFLPAGITAAIADDSSRVGGGAYPLAQLKTRIVTLQEETGKIHRLAKEIRTNYPPIFTRLINDRLIFDVRTLQPGDIDIISSSLQEALEVIYDDSRE